MDFPCAANSCIVFTVLLLIMAASCVHAESHAPQLTAISWGGQFYPGAIIRRRSYLLRPVGAFFDLNVLDMERSPARLPLPSRGPGSITTSLLGMADFHEGRASLI